MEVHRIINSIFNSNTYILDNEENSIWLVDCGDIEPILDYSRKHNRVISGVFLTHIHYDHIYGLPKLLKIYPGCAVFTSREGIEALASEKINFSRYHNDPINLSHPNTHCLVDGESVELWKSVYLKAFLTPGHNYSCISYMVKPYIFTGDSFIPGLKVVTSFPKSDKNLADESRFKILDLAKKNELIICPGHNDICSFDKL